MFVCYWSVNSAFSLVSAVLKELKEVESERVDEGAEAAHGEVEGVSDQEYDSESDPSRTETPVTDSHCGNVIESLAEHAAGQAEGIESKVTEDVAQQSCGCVVSLPQSGADVLQRVPVDVAEEEYSNC